MIKNWFGCVVIVGSVSAVSGQTLLTTKIENEYSNARVILNVLTNPVEISVDLNQKYYWYAKQTGDQTTVGGYSGQLLHGKKEVFNKEGSLTSQTNFQMGVKHGEQKFWDDDGQIQRVEYVNKGKCYKAIYYTSPDENGKWVKSDVFAVWEYTPIPLSDIKDEKERNFVASSTHVFESCLCAGLPGCSKKVFSYTSDLPLTKVNWSVGKVTLQLNYFPYSQKVKERSEYRWNAGEVGKYEEFFESGVIKTRGTIVNGKFSGDVIHYDENGNVTSTDTY